MVADPVRQLCAFVNEMDQFQIGYTGFSIFHVIRAGLACLRARKDDAALLCRQVEGPLRLPPLEPSQFERDASIMMQTLKTGRWVELVDKKSQALCNLLL